jgi:hypothetical protein
MRETIADVLRKEGREEGIEEGRREEALRARREMLLLLLRERFGKLPRKVERAVEGATELTQLEEWARRYAHAKTLDQMGIVPAS